LQARCRAVVVSAFTNPTAAYASMLHRTKSWDMLRRTIDEPYWSHLMSYQFNDPFSAYTQQFSAVAARFNRLALENAETVLGLQLRTLEKNVEATTSFLGEFAGASDLDAYRNLWPKGLQVARDNAQRRA